MTKAEITSKIEAIKKNNALPEKQKGQLLELYAKKLAEFKEEVNDKFNLDDTIKNIKKYLKELRKVKKEIDKEDNNSQDIESLKEKEGRLYDLISELKNSIKEKLEKIYTDSVLSDEQSKQLLDSYLLKLIELAKTKKEKVIKLKQLFYYSPNDDIRKKAKANLIALGVELPEKKITTNIFFNSFIFRNSSDYVIGGFLKKELDGIIISGDDSSLNMSKLKNIFEKRLDNSIDEQTEGFSEEEIESFQSSVLENYFGYEPSEIMFAGTFKELILNYSGYTNWLTEIEERLIEYKNLDSYTQSSINENAVIEVSITEATECTKNSGFYDIIECLNQQKYTLLDGYNYFSMESSMELLGISYN